MNPLLEKRLEEFLDREDARIAKEKRDAEQRWRTNLLFMKQEEEIRKRYEKAITSAYTVSTGKVSSPHWFWDRLRGKK